MCFIQWYFRDYTLLWVIESVMKMVNEFFKDGITLAGFLALQSSPVVRTQQL
jgi:hypothetical protein